MTFASTLNDYCTSLSCTGKEIAAACQISASALSRYRKGERVPHTRSETIGNMAHGLETLYAKEGSSDLPTASEIEAALRASIDEERQRGLNLCAKVDKLMTELNMRNSEIARELSVDPSFVSRIRSKQRIPAKQDVFAKRFSKIVAKESLKKEAYDELCAVTGIDAHLLLEGASQQKTARAKLARAIASWMLEPSV